MSVLKAPNSRELDLLVRILLPSPPEASLYLNWASVEGRRFVRETLITFSIMAVLALFGAPTAYAGITCKVIPTMCPPEPGHDHDGGGGSSVPEPGTLVLLMAGAGAAGAALRRRRSKP